MPRSPVDRALQEGPVLHWIGLSSPSAAAARSFSIWSAGRVDEDLDRIADQVQAAEHQRGGDDRTSRVCESRRRMKTNIGIGVGAGRKKGASGALAASRERIVALLGRPRLEGEGVLVGARLVRQVLAHRPGAHLVVQRHQPRQLADRLVRGARQHDAALGVVDRRQRLRQQRVDAGVGEAAAVGGAEPGLSGRTSRAASAAARRLAGLRAPAGEQEAELEFRAAREEHAGRHGLELGRDAVARQVLSDGLRHLRVVDVAVVRRVQRQAEAVRVARLGEQLLRAFGVVLLRLQRACWCRRTDRAAAGRRPPPGLP